MADTSTESGTRWAAPISVRMSVEVLARIDALVEATAAIPGARSNRSAMILAAIDKGLEALERVHEKRKR